MAAIRFLKADFLLRVQSNFQKTVASNNNKGYTMCLFLPDGTSQVLHGADSDVEWLQRDFGLYLVNMFDTRHAAQLLNLGGHSLAHLLKLYCGVDADKQYQLADWRIR